MNRKGEILNQVIIQIILIAIIFAVFLMATADKVNARGVRQQVLEKQMALLIDSASSGMSFSVWKVNANGLIEDIRVFGGRIYVKVEGLESLEGYPFFSRYEVEVLESEDKFTLRVYENE
jgi:hypothetical protein